MATIANTRIVTAIWAPGAVSGNATTNLPACFPEIEQLIGGAHIESTGGAYTNTVLSAIATTATPGAGNISPVDGNTIRIGTACLTKTSLVIVYRAKSGANPNKFMTAMFVPGAVNANTSLDLPATYPEIKEIIGGVQLAQSTDDLTTIALAGKAPTATLGSGYVSNSDGNSIKMGDANGTSDLVVLTYKAV